jgi:hypothetical protein
MMMVLAMEAVAVALAITMPTAVMLRVLATCCMPSIRNDHQAEPEHLVAQGATANNGFNTQFQDFPKH